MRGEAVKTEAKPPYLCLPLFLTSLHEVGRLERCRPSSFFRRGN